MDQTLASVKALEQLEQLISRECKKTDADGSEYLTSLAFCLAVLRGNPRLSREELERLTAAIDSYRSAVTRAITNNDIKRVLTQMRLVAPIERANHRLLSIVQPVVAIIGGQYAVFQSQLAPEREAREWWSLSFPTWPLQVSWELFLSMFASSLGALLPQQILFQSDVTFLRYILDCNETNYVGIWKYTELIRLLGTPPQLVGKLRELAAAKWFHGYASSSEAEKLLSLSQPGTFLLRFSKAKASAVAIAFKEAQNVYKHTVVATRTGKYTIDGNKYRSLSHLVLSYAHILSIPLESSLLRDATFFGDISGSEAQELMSGRRLGEYLWRFSSRAHYLSLTFVATEHPPQVRHVLVEEVPNGFRVENDSVVHPSLARVVAALLTLPLRTPMQHSLWLPAPSSSSSSSASSSQSPSPLLLPSPIPSPFRNLTDHRAGSYHDLDENGGAQPFAPPAFKRAPSPLSPTPRDSNDGAQRVSPRIGGGSDTGVRPSPSLRTANAIAKPPTPSPPSPKSSTDGSARPRPHGYALMPSLIQPPLGSSQGGLAPRRGESPQARPPRQQEGSPQLLVRQSGENAMWRLVQPTLQPEQVQWQPMPSVTNDPPKSPRPGVDSIPPLSLPPSALSTSLSHTPSASIAVPSTYNAYPSMASPASPDSGGSSGAASPARWEGAAPRKETSMRATSTKRAAVQALSQSPPPQLVMPSRGVANDVQWVPMPPVVENLSQSMGGSTSTSSASTSQAPNPLSLSMGSAGRPARAPTGSIWRPIKPSIGAASGPPAPADVAAAKATLQSAAANASFPSPGRFVASSSSTSDQ